MDSNYHSSRLIHDERRDILWKTLWDCYFRKKIKEEDTVLDMGCGYCEFINNVNASTLYAVDSWEGFTDYLRGDATPIVSSVTELSKLPDRSIDYAFASNLFEHLTKEELRATVDQLREKLRSRGTLTVVQPNYRYCSAEYFDDFTHVSVWSHVSLPDFLESMNFEILEVIPRFLPLTIKSRLPVSPLLIRAYLSMPISPMGKQMLVSGRLKDAV